MAFAWFVLFAGGGTSDVHCCRPAGDFDWLGRGGPMAHAMGYLLSFLPELVRSEDRS